MPYGTCYGLLQDIHSGVLIPVEHESTFGTDMRARAKRLAHTLPTARAVLARVVRGNRDHEDAMHRCIVVPPSEELPPGRVMDALGKLTVLDEVRNLKVLVGNQVV